MTTKKRLLKKIEKIERENPNLPRRFIKEILEAQKEVEEGRCEPWQHAIADPY